MKNSHSITRSLFIGLAATAALFATVFAPQPAGATIYYYDNDSDTPGFGMAGGIWDAPTPGPIPGWTTDATGASIPGSVTTAITDALNFGNGATGLGAGTVTLNGTLLSGNITFASGSGAILLSGGGASLNLAATSTITVNNSSDTIATPLGGAATSFIKAGIGKLILSGANTVAGSVTVSGGELMVNGGSFLGASAFNVANNISQQAVFNLENGSFTNSGTDSIGTGANAVGVLKLSGGNFVTAGKFFLSDGSGKTNYSAFLMSGGYTEFGNELDLGYNGLGAATYVNLSGGIMVCDSFVTVGREGYGTLDISGGTLLRPTTAQNVFYMNRIAGSFGELTIRGTGTLDLEDPAGLRYSNTTGNQGTGVVNLMTGGTLISRVGIFYHDTASSGALGIINFNGGTVRASGSSATFWTDPWAACYIYSGGAIVDSQGNNITVSQPFLVPSGSGVTAITGGTGTGYLAPPVVSISGDGTGATAIAQIDFSGNITNILISNPGVNYTTASVTLLGGGGTASGWTAAIGVNATTGGLTKLGSGTLTLTGANTYQGPTIVGGGTLAVSVAYANYPAASALTLSNNASLSADVSGGASTLATPSLTLDDNAALNLDYGSLGGNPFEPAISDSTINAGTALTANGTNIVVNLSGSGFVPGQFPIIKYSGSIGGNGFAAFKLGSLPLGVPASAQLVNNTDNNSIDLSIPLVNTLTWNGTNSDWDINTTVNWKDSSYNPSAYMEYGTTNTSGDIVTFDDSLNDPAQTNINLTTTLRPTSVNVSSYGTPYTFSGPGKLSGSGYLNVNGGAPLTITTANDYAGGSMLSGGTVLVGNDAALGVGPVVLAGSILASDSATPRTLNNPVNITMDPTFGTGPSSGPLTLAGPVDLGGVARGFTMENTVALTGPTSNGSLVKSGAGTLVVDNAGTLLTGVNTISQGTLVLGNGTFTGALNIADFLYETAMLEIGNGNITNTAANNVATGPGAVGVIKQSGGNFVETGVMAFGASGTSAAYLMSGGYASFGGDTRLDYNGAVGLISQSGGTMVSSTFFTIARDGGLGVYDLSGGTHFRPANSIHNMSFGTRADGGNAQLTIRGTGTLDIEDGQGLCFGNDQTTISYGMVNLLTGGTLISRVGFYFGNTGVGSIGYVNFNGGTLRTSGSASDYWSGWTAGYIYSGGATIDSQGNSIGIGQALLAPTGSGVISITGFSGSGYLSPPVISISGDGTGATAVAQIDSNGNLTGILVTCPGVNYTSASVNLNGGGGNGNGGTANLGVNAITGGLTKLGSGKLTLTGTNTYGGATVVNNGTLVLGEAQAATGDLTVADGATLGCWSDTPGASVHLPSTTLGVTTGASLLAQFSGNTGNPTTPAGYITNLTLNGPIAVSVLCSDIQVGTIPLFQYSMLSGTGSITTGTLPLGVAATITNNTATKTISLVVSDLVPVVLVWSGVNSSIWDINISTNWTLSGTPTTYQDGASVCLFDDTTVNGNVVITQSVSPGNIVFSNNAIAYNIGTSGAGVLSGTSGLTKSGAGTVTLSGANNYTGPTVINNGTLQIGDGINSGTLADVTGINVGASGTLAYNNPSKFDAIANNISGTGTINKDGVEMGWSGTNTFSGTINVLGGKLGFAGSDSADGQPNVNISSGGVVSIGAGFVGGTATLGNLTGAGSIDPTFGATTGIKTIQVNQTTDGIFSGPMSDAGARILALIKTGPAALTLSGMNNYTGGTIVGDGTLIINGKMTGISTLTVNSGAALGGSGTVAGIVSFSAGSVATNTVGTPLTVDTLDMAGDATMAVATVSPLAAGNYPLINYSTLTSGGQFTNLLVGGAGLSPGATASIGISNGIVSLNVVGGAPAPANITHTVNGNQLVLDWPAGQGWQLQSQTNSLNTGLTADWVTIIGAIPPFTNTITPTNPSVFYRLKY